MRNVGKARQKSTSSARLRKKRPAGATKRGNKSLYPGTGAALRKPRFSNVQDYQNFEEALRKLNERAESAYREGRQYHDTYFAIIAEYSYELLDLQLLAHAVKLRRENARRAALKERPTISYFASDEYRKYSYDVMKRRLVFERDMHTFSGDAPSSPPTRVRIETALARQRVILDRLKQGFAQTEAEVAALEAKGLEHSA